MISYIKQQIKEIIDFRVSNHRKSSKKHQMSPKITPHRWELDNKLDIWTYLLRELVPAVMTKKIIRLAAERHGWRQIGYLGIFRLCHPYEWPILGPRDDNPQTSESEALVSCPARLRIYLV